MATETDRSTTEGFGQVSRTVGTVFRYLLLVATLSGIVALAVLLAYVFYDAVQPDTAAPGWYLVYFLVLVLPMVVVGLYLRRRTERGLTVGGIALGIPVLGVLFGAGVALLFIDIIPPVAWLGYVIAFLIPFGTIVAIERYRSVPFIAKLVIVTAVFVGSMLAVPGAVASAPILPADWLILVLTLGVPVAVLVWRFLGRTFDAPRWNRIGAALTFVVIAGGGAAAPIIGLGRTSGTVLMMTAVVPFCLYAVVSRYTAAIEADTAATVDEQGVETVAADEQYRPDWLGLGFPVVVIGGMFLGAFLVELFGFAGPQSWVDWQFLTSPHRNAAEEAGVYPAIVGSIMLMIIVALVSFPLGVGAAVYLEEYAPDT
ncbi:MAG: phosphate ABC transporter, permease protein PstA, partial [Halobacteriales archaeon]